MVKFSLNIKEILKQKMRDKGTILLLPFESFPKIHPFWHAEVSFGADDAHYESQPTHHPW